MRHESPDIPARTHTTPNFAGSPGYWQTDGCPLYECHSRAARALSACGEYGRLARLIASVDRSAVEQVGRGKEKSRGDMNMTAGSACGTWSAGEHVV